MIGEDAAGAPFLSKLMKRHTSGMNAAAHIDQGVLDFLEEAYREAVTKVRGKHEFKRLPIRRRF